MKIKNEGEGDDENVDADDARAYVDGDAMMIRCERCYVHCAMRRV